jgi:predicted PurR-regulated permease PerM
LKNAPETPLKIRTHIVNLVFFATLIFLLYQMARLLAPFSSALLWAAILALALHPLHDRVLRAFKGRAGLAAIVMTFATILLIVVPTVVLLALCASQAVALYEWASSGIQSGRLIELWNSFSSLLSEKLLSHPALATIDIKGIAIKSIGEVSSVLAGQIGPLMKNTLVMVVNLTIMFIALFFFFRNGESYYHGFMDLLPFTHEQKQSLARRLHDTFAAVINGVFLIALLQGLLTGVGFALFNVPFSVFWGFVAALLALLPVGGAALVWIPGAVYLFLTGATLQGVLLTIWGVLVVSLADNVLKPLIIGRKANIPMFILLLALLGGLQVYGFLGLLFGPLVVTLLMAFIQIYREEYLEQK